MSGIKPDIFLREYVFGRKILNAGYKLLVTFVLIFFVATGIK